MLDDAAFGAATEVTPKFLSPADPAARWTGAHGGQAFFAYATNYLIDTDHAIIVDVEATTAVRRAEVLAAKRMVERAMNSFNLYPARLLGDSAYGSAEMLGWLVYEHGIEPHVTVFDKSSRKDGTFSREDFHYDHERDVYLCPGGKMLTTTGTRVNDDATLLYRASKANCEGCSLKPRCCPKDVARKVPRSVHEGARDMARAIAKSGRKRRHGARSAQGIRGRMGQAISSDWPGLASGLAARTRGSFPNDDAALKLLYLAIKNAGMRWRRGIEWTAAMGQFAIQFGERFLGTAR